MMVTERDIWRAITGGGTADEWWESIRLSDGADIDTPGTIYVTVENPEVMDSYIHKEFTAGQLLDVYNSMPPYARLHCGGDDIITNHDACSFDRIMQWAFFGELVFA
jgi:hypothetical protein